MASDHSRAAVMFPRHEVSVGLRPGELNLRPCAYCGSTSRALMAILEPDTSVCLDWRRDRRGVEWPAHPHDRYVAGLEDYVQAGVLQPPPAPVPPPIGRPRILRRPEDFSAEEQRAILADYS